MAEPEYHGNPVSNAGSLVTFHYGYDFAELIAAWSGLDVEVVRFHDHRHGVIGEFTEVYLAVKRGSGENSAPEVRKSRCGRSRRGSAGAPLARAAGKP